MQMLGDTLTRVTFKPDVQCVHCFALEDGCLGAHDERVLGLLAERRAGLWN